MGNPEDRFSCHEVHILDMPCNVKNNSPCVNAIQ